MCDGGGELLNVSPHEKGDRRVVALQEGLPLKERCQKGYTGWDDSDFRVFIPGRPQPRFPP